MASHTIQDAVLRNLQTMAEATQQLSNFGNRRDRRLTGATLPPSGTSFVHDYLGRGLGEIWKIIQRDVPALKLTIAAMLEAKPRDRK